ncbi:MAG TPA: 30S ribosomal protein S6 [Clostridiales bacterium]|jgi:small subunit ribosomal protein S6|nr:30S ribosomal protein S6 [Clostridiales bacterium]
MKATGKYESIFIINATLDAETIEKTVNRFKTLVEENGTLDSIEEWGKRRLAYPIDDMNEGYYVLMKFTAPTDFPAELDRIYNITDAIIRSLIIVEEKSK